MNLNDCAYAPVRPADFDYDAALEGLREKIRRKTRIKRQLAYFAEEALAWIGDWVKHSTKKHSGGYSDVQTTISPLVEELAKACAAKEAACREIDDRIREMVISK